MPASKALFTMNGKVYATDAETINVLRSIVPDAHRTGDASAVAAVMGLGLKYGRITERGAVAPMEQPHADDRA